MSDPGMVMYSRAWMDKYISEDIPPVYHYLIRDICRAFELGNLSDPISLYNLIFDWQKYTNVEIKPADLYETPLYSDNENYGRTF